MTELQAIAAPPAPAADAAPLPAGPVLYDATTAGIATFMGSPLAGAMVIALNYRRLGRREAALGTLLAGILVTAALLVAAFRISPASSSGGSVLLLPVITIAVAKGLQEPLLQAHRRAGGPVGTRWFGVLAGVLASVVVLAVVIPILLMAPDTSGARLQVGTRDEIFYSGAATEDDARALAAALTRDGYFRDRGVSVRLSKDGGPALLSFVVKDGTADDPKMTAAFEVIARDAAPAIGGLPVQLRLEESAGATEKSWLVQ